MIEFNNDRHLCVKQIDTVELPANERREADVLAQVVVSESECASIVRKIPPGLLAPSEINDLCANSHAIWSLRQGAQPSRKPGSTEVVVTDPQVVQACAKALFGNLMLQDDFFHTSNRDFFEYEYFPTYFAKHGEGIFFDERLASGLKTLNIVSAADGLVGVDDLGGWEDLENLDARIRLRFANGRTAVIIGGALLPLPPQTIRERESTLRQRVKDLDSHGIPHSCLAVSRGVVTQLEGDDLSERLASSAPATRLELLTSMGLVLRRLRLFSAKAVENPEESPFADADVADFRQARGIRSLFVVLSQNRIAWRDIRVSPTPLMGKGSSLGRRVERELLNELGPDDFTVVWTAYTTTT